MHVEGVAFFISQGRPGYLYISFTDQSPGAAYGIPVALVRGLPVAGGQESLARAVLAGGAADGEGTVAVYVAPETTDLEITFLWGAGFRPRKVRRHEAAAAKGRWAVAACRHFAQRAGLARRLPPRRGGPPHPAGRGVQPVRNSCPTSGRPRNRGSGEQVPAGRKAML